MWWAERDNVPGRRRAGRLSQLSGRVALVSGGSRGIGAAVVGTLAAAGWHISFCHQDDDQAALEVEKTASELGARVLSVRADVTHSAEVASWVRRAEEELGPVHAAVSCAGIAMDRPLTRLADVDWRALTDTSLDGAFHVCRAVLPAMIERQSGRIVTISSVASVYRAPREGNSPPPRAGIAAFTRELASQTRRFGIRANAIAPAAAASRADMTLSWPEVPPAPLSEAIAIRRFASATAVADRVAFLLSAAAADITGTIAEMPVSMSI
jgi:3-oxoacyl-[acyl-carrier protein] reductase